MCHLGGDIKEMRHPAASLTGKAPLLGHPLATRLLNGRDATPARASLRDSPLARGICSPSVAFPVSDGARCSISLIPPPAVTGKAAILAAIPRRCGILHPALSSTSSTSAFGLGGYASLTGKTPLLWHRQGGLPLKWAGRPFSILSAQRFAIARNELVG